MASSIEQRVSRSLRAILADLPGGSSIGDSEQFRQVLSGLESFLPHQVLSEIYPEWNHESLDGIWPLVARKAVAATAGLAESAGESHKQVGLLRCIFGNLFHPVAINPAWLTWNHGTVPKLAQAIYDERAYDRMPILADALEESGCTNTEILTHCRESGEHVRGCWVVDLLLGKE